MSAGPARHRTYVLQFRRRTGSGRPPMMDRRAVVFPATARRAGRRTQRRLARGSRSSRRHHTAKPGTASRPPSSRKIPYRILPALRSAASPPGTALPPSKYAHRDHRRGHAGPAAIGGVPGPPAEPMPGRRSPACCCQPARLSQPFSSRAFRVPSCRGVLPGSASGRLTSRSPAARPSRNRHLARVRLTWRRGQGG